MRTCAVSVLVLMNWLACVRITQVSNFLRSTVFLPCITNTMTGFFVADVHGCAATPDHDLLAGFYAISLYADLTARFTRGRDRCDTRPPTAVSMLTAGYGTAILKTMHWTIRIESLASLKQTGAVQQMKISAAQRTRDRRSRRAVNYRVKVTTKVYAMQRRSPL